VAVFVPAPAPVKEYKRQDADSGAMTKVSPKFIAPPSCTFNITGVVEKVKLITGTFPGSAVRLLGLISIFLAIQKIQLIYKYKKCGFSPPR
jgi:hypothetical protein